MKKNNSRKQLLALGISTALLTTASATRADNTRIEEIIVVATKREQSIQDVPISMLAHTGENLVANAIDDMHDLSEVTPGLNINSTAGTSVVMLRGIGTFTSQAGQEASVATYIDDIYNPAGTANLSSFYDIERVEVLKGPQGTLFGRNATGGLIHVITKNPTHEPEAKFRIGYGRYDTVEAGFYGSTALTDTLAANISVHYSDAGESYIQNPLPGLEFLPEKRHSVRAKLLYTPSEKTELKFSFTDSHYEGSDSVAWQPMPGSRAQNGLPGTGSYYSLAHDIQSYAEYDATDISLHYKHAMNSFDIINIIGYRKTEFYGPGDNEGTSDVFVNAYPRIDTDFISEEFRLVSTGDSKLHWLTGLYLSEFTTSYDPLLVTVPGGELVNRADQDTFGWGIFGEIDWSLTNSTSLVIGLRFNKDEQELKQEPSTFSGIPLFPYGTLEEEFEETTYRIGINHDVNDDLMLYGTYSRGYKTGSFNMVNLNGPPQPAVQPEILDAYELGFKASALANGKLIVNGAFFYYDYQDLQVQRVDEGIATIIVNAAEATLYGGEIEIVTQPLDNLSLAGGVSVIRSEYDDYIGAANLPSPDGIGGIVVPNVDFSGNSLMRAPELTFNVSVDYRIPTSVGSFGINLNYYYNDGFWWDQANTLKEESYELVNMTLSWANISERLKLTLWGKNITNTKHSSWTVNIEQAGNVYAPAPPATYGIRGEYSF